MKDSDWIYIRNKLDSLQEEQVRIRIEIAKLKMRSSFFGLVAGSIPALGILIYKVFDN